MNNKKYKANDASKELRISVQPQKFEIRKNADGSRSISGYAAVFNSLSQDLAGFREKIQPGAFAKSLRDNPDVMCLYGHDSLNILGRVSSGTLTINEDRKGLMFTCKLPNTSVANDLIALMERGDLSAMSFGFIAIQDDWQNVDGQLIRTLIEVMCYEISVVGSPAYTDTTVNLRSIPKALRGLLAGGKRSDNSDSCDDVDKDEDGNCRDDDEERCDCTCDSCEAEDCANCSDSDCVDDACEDCPAQDDLRSMRERLYRLQRRALGEKLEQLNKAAADKAAAVKAAKAAKAAAKVTPEF